MTKKDKLRQWLLPEKFPWNSLRYKNPYQKGIYWYWFSLMVRHRDVEMFGRCISCGTGITVESSQAGHFIPANGCGRDLLFHPRNVNAECRHCNAFDEMHLFGYAEGLDMRYGGGTSEGLRMQHKDYRKSSEALKDFTAKQYEDLIRALPSYQQALLAHKKEVVQ